MKSKAYFMVTRRPSLIYGHLFALGAFLLAPSAFAQCAPGIPSAGNPGCIPPNQANSPYYQGANSQAPAPQAVWEDRWGAIAIDSAAVAGGTITHQPSKRDAEKAAVAICESRGGSACEIILTFHNQCAAAAQRPQGGLIGSSGAPTKNEAEDLAIAHCGDRTSCRLIFSDCSYAERVD